MKIIKIPLIITVLIIFVYFSIIINLPGAQHKGASQYLKDSIALTSISDSIEKYLENDYLKSYQFILKGLDQYKNTPYLKGRIWLLQRASVINCYFITQLDSSIFYLNEMRELSDQINYKKGELWYYLLLGNIYYVQKDLNKAISLYRNVYLQTSELGDSIIMADALAGIADILLQQKQYDSSKYYLQKTIQIANKLNMLRPRYMAMENLANIYYFEEKYDSAYLFFSQALQIAEELNYSVGIEMSKLNILFIERKRNNNIDIIENLYEILYRVKELGENRIYIEVGYALELLLEEKQEYQKALELYKELTSIEDSLIGNVRIRKVVEGETQYYLNQKELEKQQLIKEAEIHELKLRNRKIIIFFGFLVLILSFVLLMNIYRKYKVIKQNIKTIKNQERKIFNQEKALLEKEKDKINHKLELQKKEISGKVMKIYHHNQMIEMVVDELNNIRNIENEKGRNKKQVNNKIQSLINQLRLSSNDQMWSEFENSFNEANPGFLNRLSDKFPDITPNEIKLCVFLALNLRTKEISVITQQSIKSINVARTRLRRKLNIDNTNTNISTFLKQV